MARLLEKEAREGSVVDLPAIPAFRHRETGDIAFYVTHGYAYVHADTRGTGHSTSGDWAVLAQAEQDDIYDTIEWIADQPWSCGRVGMIGESADWTHYAPGEPQPSVCS